jgi:hypothetical protein
MAAILNTCAAAHWCDAKIVGGGGDRKEGRKFDE